jgi:predicted phage replisome organizer/uncharacterized phage protein (TIGR02220 family)
MTQVKWIKLTTSIFDNEKIKFIDGLPDRDTLFVIWIKLIVLAGKTNADGYIFLTEKVPYTDEMLANAFNRPLNTVRLALSTFEKLEMIEVDERGIYLTGWSEYQSADSLEKIREQTRLRVQRHRKKVLPESNATRNVTVTGCNAGEIDREEEKDVLSSDSALPSTTHDNIPFRDIVQLLNERTGKSFRPSSKATRRLIAARWQEGYRPSDFEKAITNMAAKWATDPKMVPYLRPETLFGTKFESYLNADGGRSSRPAGYFYGGEE